MRDFADSHEPVSDVFAAPGTNAPLSDAQMADYENNGFVIGNRLLDDSQIESLRSELAELMQSDHDGRELWYEYHSNESTDPNTVLFHALGSWRLRPAFHDVLWNGSILREIWLRSII